MLPEFTKADIKSSAVEHVNGMSELGTFSELMWKFPQISEQLNGVKIVVIAHQVWVRCNTIMLNGREGGILYQDYARA